MWAGGAPQAVGADVLLLAAEEREGEGGLDVGVAIDAGRDAVDDALADVAVPRQPLDLREGLFREVVKREIIRPAPTPRAGFTRVHPAHTRAQQHLHGVTCRARCARTAHVLHHSLLRHKPEGDVQPGG